MNEYKKDRPTSEQLVDFLDNELEITICADVVHGLDYEYKQLQEENKKLNGAIQIYDILLKSNVEENKQLKDNWNKLKEWFKNNIDKPNIKFILETMQELEQGSDNNVKD